MTKRISAEVMGIFGHETQEIMVIIHQTPAIHNMAGNANPSGTRDPFVVGVTIISGG